MNEEKAQITPSQLMFLVAGFIIGSVLLLSFMDNLVKQDSWLVIIAAFIACIPFVLSMAMLAKKFPNMNLIDIMKTIYGRFLGSIFFFLYVGYFFVILSFNLRDLANFYIGFIMPEMPLEVLLVVIMLVSAYAVYKGLQSIAKVGFFSLVSSVSIIVITVLLLIKDMDFKNFLPILEVPKSGFIQGTHIFTAIPFCEVVIFFMVMPSVTNSRKTVRRLMGGVAIAALSLLVITVRNTAVLGPSSSIYAGNSYQAARMINIGEFLTRVELLTAIGITFALFIKITVIYYATVQGVTQLLRLRSPSTLILPIGFSVVLLAIIGIESTFIHTETAMRYQAFFPLLFSFILPPLSLVVAAIRGLPKTG